MQIGPYQLENNLILAPMAGISDRPFRELCKQFGASLAVSEMVASNPALRQHKRTLLKANHNGETGLRTVQILGTDPGQMADAARFNAQHGAHIIDINMGCPAKKVVKNKSCANLINYPELAKEIVYATAESTHLPVSIKTRIGFSRIITEEWISHLLETAPAAITVHGRTRKMMSNGPALWDEIGKAVTLRNQLGSETLMIGNGEVFSYSDALNRIAQYGVDGVMVGTGVFKNPWMFNTEQVGITIDRRIALMRKHITLYQNTWGNGKDYNVLKRFFKIYLNGFSNAAHWRDAFMRAHGYDEALSLLDEMEEKSGI